MTGSEFDKFMTVFGGCVVCLIGLALMVIPPVGILVIIVGVSVIMAGFKK